MSPVTEMAGLAGRILSSLHMENFSLVTELRFRPLSRRTRSDLSSFRINRAGVFMWENV